MKSQEKVFHVVYCCEGLELLVKEDAAYFYADKTGITFQFCQTDQEFYFCPFCGAKVAEEK